MKNKILVINLILSLSLLILVGCQSKNDIETDISTDISKEVISDTIDEEIIDKTKDSVVTNISNDTNVDLDDKEENEENEEIEDISIDRNEFYQNYFDNSAIIDTKNVSIIMKHEKDINVENDNNFLMQMDNVDTEDGTDIYFSMQLADFLGVEVYGLQNNVYVCFKNGDSVEWSKCDMPLDKLFNLSDETMETETVFENGNVKSVEWIGEETDNSVLYDKLSVVVLNDTNTIEDNETEIDTISELGEETYYCYVNRDTQKLEKIESLGLTETNANYVMYIKNITDIDTSNLPNNLENLEVTDSNYFDMKFIEMLLGTMGNTLDDSEVIEEIENLDN